MSVKIKLIFLFCTTSAFILGKTQLVQGQDNYSTVIDATVKISVCGNGIIEGGEDCEGFDLNGKNCIDIGYSWGTLTCDTACTFDTALCVAPSATPTPIPTPTLTTPDETPVVTTFPQSTPQTIQLTPYVFDISPNPSSSPNDLPSPLQVFDLYGNGKLLVQDLSVAVKMWVVDWREHLRESFDGNVVGVSGKSCDLNGDDKCDLKDFSILMYYFER